MNKLFTVTGLAALLVLGGCASTQDAASTDTPNVDAVSMPPATTPIYTPTPTPTYAPTVMVTPAASATTHVVAKEDTLYNISKRYSVTVKQLQTWNKLKGNSIKIGQTLKVVAP
ncbi:MAG: LysM peptidoglycan-binding domain-containing protein [Thiotrichaceae bacterium]|nr:LysM peptidoglycan-binding domain-containing protein [Thiotrichaceae bacterium]